MFIAALTALGRHPADYSSGVAAKITAAACPRPVAVARLLLRLLDTLEPNVDGVLRDIDTEFLHDLRVAVRRTRSAHQAARRGAARPTWPHRYAAEFKWLGDLTTPTRDLDVHLLGFDAMAGQLLAASPADLEPFRAFLVRRRAREFRAAGRGAALAAVPRPSPTTGARRCSSAAATPDASAGADRGTTWPSHHRPRLPPDRRAGGAITPDSPAGALHDLRKRAKELRYLLEFFAPLHDPVAYRKVVGDLKRLQDCLGDFQDSQVQREEIGALAEAMLAERAAPAATLLAMGEIAAKLARQPGAGPGRVRRRGSPGSPARRASSASAPCSERPRP